VTPVVLELTLARGDNLDWAVCRSFLPIRRTELTKGKPIRRDGHEVCAVSDLGLGVTVSRDRRPRQRDDQSWHLV
jgi:hypothetical protein